MIRKAAIIPTTALVMSCNAFASDADWSASGFIRQEFAAKLGDKQNIDNAGGNPFNGVAVQNEFLGGGNTLMRPASAREDTDFNLFNTRMELDINGRLSSNWSARIKLRGIKDEIGLVENAYKGVDLYRQPFGLSNNGSSNFEAAGKSWMLDLPQAYLDYANGPFWLRIGNQQIAWGEAIFFRVADQVNGLDLRRHSVLGVAAEEFSDSRVPAPAVRGSFRVNEQWEVEGFVQRFQPTLLGNRNSPYNVIPSQFIVNDRDGYEDVNNKWNFGAKIRGSIGDVGLSAFAIRRVNPDGVFSWAPSQGATAINGTAFSGGGGTGVFSAQEWFRYAAHSRLDGFGALETALNEFPVGMAPSTSGLAAFCNAPGTAPGAIRVDRASAGCILDAFFTGGDLNGWIQRKFFRENIFGGSVNYIFEGEPDSFLDQLIGRFEFSYTPNKRFTNPTLSQKYIEKDETQFAFIFEKYHKFSPSFPATYFVAQWLHKSASDIFGRSLEGSDNTPGNAPKGISGGANYYALAIQQPSPTLEWRFDLTAMTDGRGGWLVQPGTRWRPNKSFQLDVYGNYIQSTRSDYVNFAQDMGYARELFVRGTLFF